MSRRTDQEWRADLQAAGAVQRQAFADLGRYLYTVVYNYLKQRQAGLPRLQHLDASELEELSRIFTQDALQVIWEKLPTYAGRGRFTSWAATIAIHTAAYDLRKPYWRTERMTGPTSEPDDEAEEWGGAHRRWQDTTLVAADARLQLAEMMQLVERTIEQDLSERQRIAFIAQFLEDRDSDDIAAELGVTRNAVYLLIYEARRKIKRRLLEAGHTPEDLLEIFR